MKHWSASRSYECCARGFCTYAMFCPLLPGIADSTEQIDRLIKFATEVGAEEIFDEPVNARGLGLKLTKKALQESGFEKEAATVQNIRRGKNWSRYTAELIASTQQSTCKFYNINLISVLLYPSKLTSEDLGKIQNDDRGVVWLGQIRPYIGW